MNGGSALHPGAAPCRSKGVSLGKRILYVLGGLPLTVVGGWLSYEWVTCIAHQPKVFGSVFLLPLLGLGMVLTGLGIVDPDRPKTGGSGGAPPPAAPPGT